MSSYQNRKSSAVKGCPSDHLSPLRRKIVRDLPVVAEPPVLDEAGRDLVAGVVPHQDLVRGDDAVAVLVVGGPGEAAAPPAAVLPDLLQGLDDHQVARLGQALLDRGQLAGLDQLGQHRRFLERLGELRQIADDLGAFQLADELGAELRLRLAGQRRRRAAPGRRRRHRRPAPPAAGTHAESVFPWTSRPPFFEKEGTRKVEKRRRRGRRNHAAGRYDASFA